MPTLPASDAFTAPDNTSLNGRTLSTGQVWETTGGWQITGNRVRQPGITSASRSPVALDAGTSDADVSVGIYIPSSGAYIAGLTFRYVDNLNYWRASLDSLNNFLGLQQFVNGSVTTVKSVSVPASEIRNKLVRLQAVVVGNKVTFYLDGVEKLTYDTLPASSATRCGLSMFADSTNYGLVEWDDFTVADASPVVVTTLPTGDDFTGTDGTTLQGRKLSGGQAWDTITGAWELNGNRLRQTATGSPAKVALYESGQTNLDTAIDIIIPASGAYVAGSVVRAVDISNFWRVTLDSRTDGGSLILFEFIGGTGYNRRSVPISGLAGTTRRLRVVTQGDQLYAYLNGVLSVQHTIGAAVTGATKAGLSEFRNSTGYGAVFFDAYNAATLPTTAEGAATGAPGTASGTGSSSNPVTTAEGVATAPAGTATGEAESPNTPTVGAGAGVSEPGTATARLRASTRPRWALAALQATLVRLRVRVAATSRPSSVRVLL